MDVLRRVHLITETPREQSASSSRIPSRVPSIINVDREGEGGALDAASVVSAATSNTEIDPKARINLDTKI